MLLNLCYNFCVKYFKFLTLFFISFFILACNQEPGKQAPAQSKNTFETQPQTPLEKLINKVQNTVIIEPLRSLEENQYFYNMKQSLSRALENSTQKEIFFSCGDFKKDLKMLLQTDYSTDFPAGSWQRGEVENLAQDLAKIQCSEIYTLRADFLAELQNVVNNSDTKEEFTENAKPVVENYAKSVLEKNEFYTGILNKVLEPYKKLRQIFYPLEQAGYGTYLLEQNDFKSMKQIVLPYIQGKTKQISEVKVKKILDQAQEEEKVLFVFLKKYETLIQIDGECIKQFFKGLQEKWYDFMYEIEKLPAKERQAYADKRFNQAKTGLQNKCSDLYQKAEEDKKKRAQQAAQAQAQAYQPEPEEDDEQYYF